MQKFQEIFKLSESLIKATQVLPVALQETLVGLNAIRPKIIDQNGYC